MSYADVNRVPNLKYCITSDKLIKQEIKIGHDDDKKQLKFTKISMQQKIAQYIIYNLSKVCKYTTKKYYCIFSTAENYD